MHVEPGSCSGNIWDSLYLFWSTRDWLAGARPTRSSISLNPRLKRLLFLICLNGGALALECILQRIYYGDYRGKLLFLVEPGINSRNIAQFGPFAYRSNAAILFKLDLAAQDWGYFIQLGRENLDYGKRRIGNGPELLLIPCIILAASGPIISSARGGALVMIGLLILVAVSLMFMNVRSKFLRFSVVDGTLRRPRHRVPPWLGKDRASVDKHLFGQHEQPNSIIRNHPKNDRRLR